MMKQTDMNPKTRHYISMAWLAGALLLTGASCQTDQSYPEGQTVEGVTLTLSASSSLQTRTTLPAYDGTEDGTKIPGTQHVTDVFLYIYEQDANSQDYTCRAMQDVQWTDRIERTADGKLPTTTAKLTYSVSYGFQTGKSYKLVAVGLDCAENADEMPDYDGHNSALTYGLPHSISTGSKLSQAVRMVEGKTTGDLMHSEFFAGSIDFSPQTTEPTDIGTLMLYRRVAGLQVCLNRIPTEVERVRVLLYNSQNTQVPVIPADPDFVTSPYGGEAHYEEGRVLMDIGTDKFEIELGDPSSGVATDTTYRCQSTAFLLPMDRPDSQQYDYTLMVEFVTTGITGIVGESTKVRLTKPWKGGDDLAFGEQYDIGTGIIDDLNKYLFPIEANHFYSLGTPSHPIDCSNALKGQKP